MPGSRRLQVRLKLFSQALQCLLGHPADALVMTAALWTASLYLYRKKQITAPINLADNSFQKTWIPLQKLKYS